MAISQDMILEQLERIKQNKQRKGYMAPKDYQEFMPETLGYRPRDMSLSYKLLDQTREQGEDATRLTQVMEQGERERAEMIRRRRELRRARKAYQQAQNSQPKFNPNVSGGNVSGDVQYYGNYEGERNFGRKWGKDNTPEVSDLGRINAGAPIVTMNYRGHNIQVNRQVAPIFVAFLDDLYATGYRPVSIGGHNDRNIAGTNTPSLHSYGLAIDIDPSKNPVGPAGSNNHQLPPNVGALAAKYGLSWGGNWNSYKDPMHFSVPYGGRE